MIDITTYIHHEDDIDVLGSKYSFLKDIPSENPAFKNWRYKDGHKKGYIESKVLNVIFIGQTGYGKSSLLNKLLGLDIFETSDVKACTKNLQCADYFLHHKFIEEKKAYVLSFVDLPGIGENDKSDDTYLRWYKEYIEDAAVVVYLFRADKRDYAQDEFFFNNVFDKSAAGKLVCLLSQADKIEPINRSSTLSEDQLFNIEKKKQELAAKPFLNFYKSDIIHISSELNINIDKLHKVISNRLMIRTLSSPAGVVTGVLLNASFDFLKGLFG